jgi:hypothetical protein
MVSLAAIELDTSIQCRAAIDTAVVNEYAERMSEGDTFPPVEVFGTKTKCWIGDGWHRVLAAKQNGAEAIEARLTPGGRTDALKHALGANAMHGHRRSNADKRRSVEIALREFPKLSSRAIAKMCGVGHHLVEDARPQLGESTSSTRTGLDGKERPATREPASAPREAHARERRSERPVLGPPSNGMQFARMAIMDLEQIRPDDVERAEAFTLVREWIDAREN